MSSLRIHTTMSEGGETFAQGSWSDTQSTTSVSMPANEQTFKKGTDPVKYGATLNQRRPVDTREWNVKFLGKDKGYTAVFGPRPEEPPEVDKSGNLRDWTGAYNEPVKPAKQNALPRLPDEIIDKINGTVPHAVARDPYVELVKRGYVGMAKNRPVNLYDPEFNGRLRALQAKWKGNIRDDWFTILRHNLLLGEDRPITFGDIYKHGSDFFCAVQNDRREGEKFPIALVRDIMHKAATTERTMVTKMGTRSISVNQAIMAIIKLIVSQTTQFHIPPYAPDADGKKTINIHFRGLHMRVKLKKKFQHDGEEPFWYIEIYLTVEPSNHLDIPEWAHADNEGRVFIVEFIHDHKVSIIEPRHERKLALIHRLEMAIEGLPGDCIEMQSILIELMFGQQHESDYYLKAPPGPNAFERVHGYAEWKYGMRFDDGIFTGLPNDLLVRHGETDPEYRLRRFRFKKAKVLLLEHLLWAAFCSKVTDRPYVRLLDIAV